MSDSLKARSIMTNHIKLWHSYSIPEIAALIGAKEATIHAWVREEGLSLIDDKRPHYIHGTVLIPFLKAKKQKRRQTLTEDQFYCTRCKGPRKIADSEITIEGLNTKIMLVRGRCLYCKARVSKIHSVTKRSYIISKYENVEQLERD